jgi:LysR family hydrogen peroxide-inducible transcriptional activator
MPTITQLEYLVAVDRTRHFGRAAKECHVSQPALSAQIQKLEEELGVVVFDRKKKPVLPTPEGERILELARSVLREHAKLLHLAQSEGDEPTGGFKIGIIPTLAPYVLPLFVDAFAKEYPAVDLHIDELKTEEIILALREDRIDAGLLATPLGEKGLRERPLFYEPFYAYCAPGHPLLKRKKLRETDLEPHGLWLLQDGHCLRNQVVNFCSANNATQTYDNVHFESGNLETLRYLVHSGEGYTLLPHLMVLQLPKSEREKYVRPFVRPVPTREVSLVFRRDQFKQRIQRALFDCIRERIPDGLFDKESANMQVLDIEPND